MNLTQFKSDLKFDIISEKDSIEEPEVQNVESPIKGLTINQKGLKSSQILKTIGIFQSSIRSKLPIKDQKTMNALTQEMLNFVEEKDDNFKRHQGESIAICMLLLIASKLGISKKDYLEPWKPLKRKMFKSIDNIKSSTCYPILKPAFAKIWRDYNSKKKDDEYVKNTKNNLNDNESSSALHRSRTLDGIDCGE